MTLTAAELCLVADEIRELAAGARVVKIGQPEPDRVAIRLFREDDERTLLLVASRPFPRAHFADEAGPNPRTPSGFCDALRAHLTPGRLFDAAVLPHDRVLVLAFDVKTDAGVLRRTLYAELYGSKPNLVLVDERRRILAALEESPDGARPIAVDGPYVPPDPPPKELVPRAPWESFGPDFRPAGLSGGALSRALDAYFAPRDARALLDGEVKDLRQDLARSRKKLEKLRDNVAADLRAVERVPVLRAEGELLKANLAAVKRGAKKVELDEWTSGEAVRRSIALDPSKSALENAQARFDEARRLEKSAETAQLRADAAEHKLGELADADRRVAEAADRDAVRKLRDELLRRGFVAPPPPPPKPPEDRSDAKSKVQEQRKCYRVFKSADGLEMLVGRTASDNDELTFRVANGDDFWFHVRDYPGSHVVIRSRPELPPETLLDAATLAVHFSKSEFAGSRDVSWTRRKWVQKHRGAPAGQVLLSQHKTLRLRCDPDRLKRLLGPDRV